jgi:hypothetical protein
MSVVKLIAAGALGLVAYRAWQRHRARAQELSKPDDGTRTPPHGDPVLVGQTLDIGPAPAAGVQSSRSFGEL